MGRITAGERAELKRLIKARCERLRVDTKAYVEAEKERMRQVYAAQYPVPPELAKAVVRLRKQKAALAKKAEVLAMALNNAGCRQNYYYNYPVDKEIVLNPERTIETQRCEDAYKKFCSEQPSQYDVDQAAAKLLEQLQDELLCTALEGSDAKMFLTKIPGCAGLIALAKKGK